MLCESYTPYPMQHAERDEPMPKFKRRFNSEGQADIYGEYDINNTYRAFDYAETHEPLEVKEELSVARKPKRRRFNVGDEPALMPKTKEDGDDEDEVVAEQSNEVLREENDDEESSGEYPVGYFEMHVNSDGRSNRGEQRHFYQSQSQRAISSVEPYSSFSGHQLEVIRSAVRMCEALKDIKAIILKPVKTSEDAAYHLALVRKIIQVYETPPSDYGDGIGYDAGLTREPLVQRQCDETIDMEYQVSRPDIDAYYCNLCDKSHLFPIRYYEWEAHCRARHSVYRKNLAKAEQERADVAANATTVTTTKKKKIRRKKKTSGSSSQSTIESTDF